MINYSELKKGTRILLKGQPYEIIECAPLFKGRGHSVLPAKIKNLITGEITSWTFRPADSFETPEISKIGLKYLYFYPVRKSSISNGASKDRYVFSEKDNPSKRFDLTKEKIGESSALLKPQQDVSGLFFEGKLIDVSLPIKITLEVIEAPPSIRGQSAQAGTKPVTLETGAKINTPLFIKKGDIIEINTETGEYVKRVS